VERNPFSQQRSGPNGRSWLVVYVVPESSEDLLQVKDNVADHQYRSDAYLGFLRHLGGPQDVIVSSFFAEDHVTRQHDILNVDLVIAGEVALSSLFAFSKKMNLLQKPAHLFR